MRARTHALGRKFRTLERKLCVCYIYTTFSIAFIVIIIHHHHYHFGYYYRIFAYLYLLNIAICYYYFIVKWICEADYIPLRFQYSIISENVCRCQCRCQSQLIFLLFHVQIDGQIRFLDSNVLIFKLFECIEIEIGRNNSIKIDFHHLNPSWWAVYKTLNFGDPFN